MLEVLGLILPLFGLILLGFVGGKIVNQPIEALGWLNTFIIYFALPALLFPAMATIPLDDVFNWPFIAVYCGGMLALFIMSFLMDEDCLF